jgi:hypothetical protein
LTVVDDCTAADVKLYSPQFYALQRYQKGTPPKKKQGVGGA